MNTIEGKKIKMPTDTIGCQNTKDDNNVSDLFQMIKNVLMPEGKTHHSKY